MAETDPAAMRLEAEAPGRVPLDTGVAILDVHPDEQGRVLEQDPAEGLAFGQGGTTAGLVDLQVNGFAGVDFNDPGLDAGALDRALLAMLASGVTVCLPTIITAQPDELRARFAALDEAVAASRLGRWMVPGYHLEGPFLNPADGYAGCHPPDAMGVASWDLVASLEAGLRRPILLVTAAPERPGVPGLIERARAAGKLVAIGHSAVDAAGLEAAVAAGASLSTHLGNGLPQTLPKLANPFLLQLAEDRLVATVIADGIHVPPAVLKVMLRAKGLDRLVLVTDAISAAGATPGLHPFAGMTVELTADGTVRQPGSAYLAGSSLRLDQAVRNLVAWGLATPREALRLACANPLALLREPLRRHGIELPFSSLRWSAELRVEEARVGPLRLRG
ncbi:N-acetylglucosamine-6-phosphate deacetylase [Geminicoccus roseus]|uniref:N-acetylglucosamine-6-phosphate deacetylase n=1 Tax=Geminicoccus roseus TaxID=404900 RepID=UPI00041DBD87|nr:amidohydrolase family protein [Geminicoccus roseus]